MVVILSDEIKQNLDNDLRLRLRNYPDLAEELIIDRRKVKSYRFEKKVVTHWLCNYYAVAFNYVDTGITIDSDDYDLHLHKARIAKDLGVIPGFMKAVCICENNECSI